MSAISRICGNESQPGLQLVEKLAMPLVLVHYYKKTRHEWDIYMGIGKPL